MLGRLSVVDQKCGQHIPNLPKESNISLKKLNDGGLPPSNIDLTIKDKNLTTKMQFPAYKKDKENMCMEQKQLNYVIYQ